MTTNHINDLFGGLVLPDRAKPARFTIINHLKKLGYKVTVDFPIETKSNAGRSLYIEIIAIKGDDVLAIEVDRRIPGSKALIKMQSLDNGYTKVILLRNPNYGFRAIGSNTFIIGLKSYRI